jgi:hypothetical protein
MRQHSPIANGVSDNDMIIDGVELPSLLPIEKAACVLRVNVATIKQWIGEGLLEVARVNGKIRVLTSSLEDRMGEATQSRSNQELHA